MTGLKTVSLFAGIGGIDRGLELAGVPTALVCEIDPHARKILGRHYPHAAIHNDVTELTADDLRAAGLVPGRTILTAGFPCQDLSVAGRRRGMGEGTRSGLYWHVDRLLAEFRPAWVILENVPGLLSAVCPCPGDERCPGVCPGEFHTVVGGACAGGCIPVHGGAMGAVLGSLAQRGYGFAYRVLDARHFGVPQRRRRVVIVGRLGDTGAAPAQVLLEPEGLQGNPAEGITPRPVTPAHAGAGVASGVLGGVAHTLTAEGHDASEDGSGRGTPIIGFSHTAGIDVQGSEHVYPTVKAGHNSTPSVAYPTMVTYVAQEASTLAAAGGERGYRVDAEAAAGGHLVATSGTYQKVVRSGLRDAKGELPPEVWAERDLASTLNGNDLTGESRAVELIVQPDVIVRRLTPMECERLQGYPDGWTEGQADSHRYKQLGNSVAVPVFEWVARRLVAVDGAS